MSPNVRRPRDQVVEEVQHRLLHGLGVLTGRQRDAIHDLTRVVAPAALSTLTDRARAALAR